MAKAQHSTGSSGSSRPQRRSTKPRISKQEAARLLALRDRLEQHLEAMVAFLDELDGDPDLEPSLGAPIPHQQVTQDVWATGTTDDREQECEDEGAGGEDSEPSLGWPETGSGCQSLSNGAAPHDYEEQCEDEGCPNDSGIGDSDGLLEQVPGHHSGRFGTSGFAGHVE